MNVLYNSELIKEHFNRLFVKSHLAAWMSASYLLEEDKTPKNQQTTNNTLQQTNQRLNTASELSALDQISKPILIPHIHVHIVHRNGDIIIFPKSSAPTCIHLTLLVLMWKLLVLCSAACGTPTRQLLYSMGLLCSVLVVTCLLDSFRSFNIYISLSVYR
jgi:hypothetical protein